MTKVRTYETRSTQIKAIEYIDMNYSEVQEFVGKIFEDVSGVVTDGFLPLVGGYGCEYTAMLYDEVRDHWVRVKDGDMITKDADGRFISYNPEVFVKKYRATTPRWGLSIR